MTEIASFLHYSFSKPKVPAVLPLANSLSENNRSTQAKTTSVFSKLQGLQHYFPEKFSFQLKVLGKWEFYRMFGSANFRIPLSTKIATEICLNAQSKGNQAPPVVSNSTCDKTKRSVGYHTNSTLSKNLLAILANVPRFLWVPGYWHSRASPWLMPFYDCSPETIEPVVL